MMLDACVFCVQLQATSTSTLNVLDNDNGATTTTGSASTTETMDENRTTVKGLEMHTSHHLIAKQRDKKSPGISFVIFSFIR